MLRKRIQKPSNWQIYELYAKMIFKKYRLIICFFTHFVLRAGVSSRVESFHIRSACVAVVWWLLDFLRVAIRSKIQICQQMRWLSIIVQIYLYPK